MTATVSPETWSTDRLTLGEGGRWIDGRLHLVDLVAGRLLVAHADAGRPLHELLSVEVTLGAVAQIRDRPGSWLAVMGAGIGLIDDAGGIEWLARPEDDNPASVRMNDGGVDARGRFWAGSMADDGTAGAGSLYRVDRDGSVTRMVDGLSIANGPTFSPDGRSLYLADSAVGIVYQYDFDVDAGELGDRSPFVRIQPDDGLPDGMTVDVEGGLWVALWGGSAVRRYRPDGVLDRTIALPAAQPTSVCLGGPDGLDLYITSASVGLANPGPDDGAVFHVRADVAGIPAAAAVLDR